MARRRDEGRAGDGVWEGVKGVVVVGRDDDEGDKRKGEEAEEE